MKRIAPFLLATVLVISSGLHGGDKDSRPAAIHVRGADTMVQLGTAWAEAYRKVNPKVRIEAAGGGSGAGIAALQNHTTEICASARKIKSEEAESVKKARGKEVSEQIVCYEALAVYVHPLNPLDEISVEELREIWAEGGTAENWTDVGGTGGKIALVGRQSNSGTYDYFRQLVCGRMPVDRNRRFRQGISEQDGSAEVIGTVSKMPAAMGFCGMGYKTDKVKWLKLSNKKGEPGVEPTWEAVRSKSYPLSRELFLYTAGNPTGEIKAFLEWVRSPHGQAVVSLHGGGQFVPLRGDSPKTLPK